MNQTWFNIVSMLYAHWGPTISTQQDHLLWKVHKFPQINNIEITRHFFEMHNAEEKTEWNMGKNYNSI